MSFLSNLFSSNPVASASEGILNGIGDTAVKIREAITGNTIIPPELQVQLKTHLADLDNQMALAQANINAIEAGNTNMFIAGWRPFIGWICGLGLAWHFIIRQWVIFFLANRPDILHNLPQDLTGGELMSLVTALLGLGTLRTLEKSNGTEGNR